jgi:cbb3-type cytochrome oxidase maturation protein
VDIIIVLVFISLALVVAGLIFFFSRLFDGDFEHGERLSLLPLEDDDGMNQVDPGLPDDKLDKIGFNNGRTDSDPPESSD